MIVHILKMCTSYFVHVYTPGTKYIGVYSFAFSVIMFVCLSVGLYVNFFFRQRFLSNYLGQDSEI